MSGVNSPAPLAAAFRFRFAHLSLLSCLLWPGCAGDSVVETKDDEGDTSDSAAGGGGRDYEGGQGGQAGNASSGGGKGGGVGGRGGSGGQDAGASADKPDAKSAGDAKPADAAPTSSKTTYACSQFLGPNVTGEWFDAGYETHVDGARWQVKAPHRSFVEDWANPNHAVWKESGCEGTFYNCDTKSKCLGGKTPDRILFVTQTGDYRSTTQQKWQDLIASAVTTIKAKYPGLKNIELMTFVRGPANMDCGNETTVSQNLDKAQQAVAASSAGFVTVSPRFEVSRCNMFSGPPHLSGEGNKFVAQLIGKHYGALEKP